MNTILETDLPPATPAATLVLFRDRAGAAPELLMVERSKGMSFAGGAVVFPGGRVDDDDHALAARFDLDPEDAAARIAAIRETIEESLIPIGIAGAPPLRWLEDARIALHGQTPFSQLLDAAGLGLDLDALRPFARWRPGFREARVFDTRFYIARAPHDLPPPVVDATENVRTFWESAEQVLALAETGKVKVIFPTARNLERLAQFGSFDEACAQVAVIPSTRITPYVEDRDGVAHLCIPEGLGYPVTAEAMASVRRGTP